LDLGRHIRSKCGIICSINSVKSFEVHIVSRHLVMHGGASSTIAFPWYVNVSLQLKTLELMPDRDHADGPCDDYQYDSLCMRSSLGTMGRDFGMDSLVDRCGSISRDQPILTFYHYIQT
jgi:hypothetical protein